MRIIRTLVIEVAAMVAIGVVLAALGPFGSFASSFATRLSYWIPAALVGYAIFRPLMLAIALAGERLRLPIPALVLAGALIAGLPATLAIATLGRGRLDLAIPRDAFFALYTNVTLVGLIIGTLFVLAEQALAPRRAAPATASAPVPATALGPESAAPATPAPSPFDARLPPGFAQPLLALEMEDHYVRAHGADGRSALVLMRMADAVRDMGDRDGARVHRSWWVARAAVTGAARDGRNWRLLLANGRAAPVARDRVADLRAAGWL